ncbi:MAG TPA: sigma-54 dependent transcriptional regulator [Bryobacteraceae bacterium]|nr:sigma-54 dependent transcriptional regulator [Bryobacteraceae bacterium]
MAISAKVHSIGTGTAGRFSLHRGIQRPNHETREADVHSAMEAVRAAEAQNENNIIHGAVVRSERMKSVFRLVEKIARTNATVLIAGESGSGKEVVARAIHNCSLRCERPWVDVNCGALPDHLVESELFGYEKGAFSGADGQKAGMFELASGGTLFLDEIGELDAKMQVKLLRVLDGVPYYRLGGTRKVSVDARIVAATNKDLEAAAESGAFRNDLYHRLNQVSILVPPLRERRDDIAPLAYHFLHEVDPRLELSEDALNLLEDYHWPGNVREIRNVITRAAVLAERWEIRAEDLNLRLSPEKPATRPELKHQLGGLEEQVIREALEKSGGRQDVAAGLLGISRRTLLRRLKEYKTRAAHPLPASPVLSI